MDQTATGGVEIGLFGQPTVVSNGVEVDTRSRRTVGVLAFLVLSPSVHPRSMLATMFWEDAEPAVALGNLRVVLSTLRRSVPGVLTIGRSDVRVRRSPDVVVDVHRFEEACAVVLDGSLDRSRRIDAGLRAVGLYRNELLVGWERLGSRAFATWLEAERLVLERLAVDAMTTLVDLLLVDARTAEAVATALRLVAIDEYREASHLSLVRSLIAAGEPGQARRRYEHLATMMRDELRLEPSPAMTAVADRLGEPERAIVDRLSPLPAPPALYGRGDVTSRIHELADAAGQHLVTLIGAGGVGKTALAVVVAHAWRHRHLHVVYVDLSGVSDADLVVPTIVTALGAEDPRDATGWIVLDNFEQVADAAPAVAALVAESPGLSALVTSRIPLHVEGEQVIVVEPLSVPPEGASSGLTDSPAVQMFRQRTRMHGAVSESADDLDAIARICRAVDGLPLGIELAASRRRIMSAAAIADLLEDGIRRRNIAVLDGGAHVTPARHRSVTAAITGSLALLDGDGRRLFDRFAVFDGPFTIDAAVQVCCPDSASVSVHPVLSQLVDLQLVRTTDHEATTWLSLVPVMRAIAGERLARSDDHEAILERRLEHDIGVARKAAAALFTPQNRLWRVYVHRYWPTLRASLDLLHDRTDPRELEFLVALAPYLFETGAVAECSRLFARCPRPDASEPWQRARARMWAAAVHAEAIGYGSADDVTDAIQRDLDTIRREAPVPAQLEAMHLAIHVLNAAGESDAADAVLEAGATLARESGAPYIGVEFTYSRAMSAQVRGDDELARRLVRVALADATLHENHRIVLYSRMLAEQTGAGNAPGGGEATLRELLETAIEIRDRRQVAWLAASLGAVAVLEGSVADAARWFVEALDVARPSGYAIGTGFCLMGGVAVAALRGDQRTALAFHGALEHDLGSLGRGMPRAYFEPYLAIVDELDTAARTEPGLADQRRRGATSTRSRMLDELAAFLRSASIA